MKGEFPDTLFEGLSTSQWLSQDELLAEQWRSVAGTVNNALQRIPYYRRVCEEIGWDVDNLCFSADEFRDFPILHKQVVRDHISELVDPSYDGRVVAGRTSGSTGISLLVYYNNEHLSYIEAARMRAKCWWGIAPGEPHVTLWGRPYTSRLDRIAQKFKSYLMNNQLFSAFDLREESLSGVWNKLKRFKPVIIYGYPSVVYPLAVFLKENNISTDSLEIRVVLLTAESLTFQQRDLIEDVFRTKVANEYGCAETGGSVHECPSGSWHISTELTYIEFADDDGKPVPQGETGNLLLTQLTNKYMPLIRYKVGDLGAALAGTCACGRGLPMMKMTVAKESELIRVSNGDTYSSEILDYINLAVMKKFPSAILQFRVTQRTIHCFEVEVVTSQPVLHEALNLFSCLMRDQLGEDVEVKFKEVNEIPREVSGKLRYFVSRIDPESRPV